MKNQLKIHSNTPRTSGKFVFLILLCFSLFGMFAFAQTKEIKGTITDDQAELLSGASVLEKGTSNGTVSDFDGNYAITVSQEANLVFSYVGYEATEVSVGSQPVLTCFKGDNS